ncbi:hypothetical protein ACSV4D_17555 [Flavobacterium sp. ARAG 55.4]|uniref:hypothetical protein n=1 Tax=Flavobacterium sp. ARAG 55.4 TaxID=3451357 RepID=UPI003F454FFE
MNKVVFYSKEDLSAGQNLSIAENILDTLDSRTFSNINEIIEIYNIKLFFDNEIYLLKWTETETENYSQKIKNGWKVVLKSFIDWVTENGLSKFHLIEFDYTKHFWDIVERLKLYKQIDKTDFKKLIFKERFFINEILHQKNLVQFFKTEIKEYFLEKKNSAEILLSHFEQEHLTKQAELYFPKSLTDDIKELIILNYLDYEQANINYVRLIVKSRNIKLLDKTKLKAKKLSEKLNEEIFTKGSGWKNTIELSISKDQIEPKIFSSKENKSIYSYSEKILISDFSPETIMGNFAALFEFVDQYGCINLVTKNYEIDTFENVISTKSKNEYFISSTFHFKNMLSQMQFEVYTHLLKSKNIYIENVLGQIINTLIKADFKIDGFKIIIPNQQSTILEKIRMVAPEIESLLRQFNSYTEEGHIDFELIQFSTSQLHIGEIKSLVNRKYVYVDNIEITRAINCFFSNSSVLYSEPYIGKYKNLFLLLSTENVVYNTLLDIDRQKIDFLIEREYLFINEQNILKIKNLNKVYILAILRNHEVISYWYQPKDIRDEIDLMIKNKSLCNEHKLFTKEENRYINFHLNKKFTNGLDLRNKYMHGTNSFSEEQQEYDYKILLKIFLLITLKIIDDLYIYSAKRNWC